MRVFTRILIIIVLVAATLWLANHWSGNRLGNLVAWGKPLIEESFSDGSWRERWGVREGDFTVNDGRLVSTGTGASIAIYRHKLGAPVAVEFVGSYRNGSPPCDLSLLWYGDVEFDPRGNAVAGKPIFRLQVGSHDNTYSCILDSTGRCLAFSDYRIVPGQEVRLRFEIAETRLSIQADGETILVSELPIPAPAGWPALYGHYAGKAFDQVRIFRQQLSPQIPATAVPDWLAQHGRFDEAAPEYRRVAEELGSGPIAERARWLYAVCLQQTEDPRARAAWDALAGTTYADRAQAARLEERFTAGDHHGLINSLPGIYAAAAPPTKAAIADGWTRWVRILRNDKAGMDLLSAYADLQRDHLSQAPVTFRTASDLLAHLGRRHELIQRFPEQEALVAESWAALGYAEKGLALRADAGWGRAGLLMQLGRLDEVLIDGPPWAKGHALARRGRFEEILELFPDQRVYQALALQHADRFEELIRDYSDLQPICIDALIFSGRTDEAKALAGEDEDRLWQIAYRTGDVAGMLRRAYPWDRSRTQIQRWAEALQAWGKGDLDTYHAHRDPLSEGYWSDDDLANVLLILLPAADAIAAGDPASLPRRCLAVLGDREEPWKSRARSYLDLIEGRETLGERPSPMQRFCATLQADLSSADPAQARRAWVELLKHRRVSGLLRIFASARLRQLRQDVETPDGGSPPASAPGDGAG